MPEPWLRFPIACPQCGAEELFSIPVAVAAAALLKGTPIEFRVGCHDLRWAADRAEVQLLRDYLASVEGINLQHLLPRRSPPQVITR
jgi:hypothetical protein